MSAMAIVVLCWGMFCSLRFVVCEWPAHVNYSLQRSRNRVSIEPRGSSHAADRVAFVGKRSPIL